MVLLLPVSSARRPGTWQYQGATGKTWDDTLGNQCAGRRFQEASRHKCRHFNIDCVNAGRATHINLSEFNDKKLKNTRGTSALDRRHFLRRRSTPAQTHRTRGMDLRPLELDRRQHQKVAPEIPSSRGGEASPHVSDIRAKFRPRPFGLSLGNQKLSRTRARFKLSVSHANANLKSLTGADSCTAV